MARLPRLHRSSDLAKAVTISLLLSLVTTVCAAQSAKFFGMHINNHRDWSFWPELPFSSQRLHDSGVSWREIETAPGKYDWAVLDHQLRRAREHNVEILYDFARVPEFYTKNPNSQCASEFGGGACAPERCAKYGGNNANGCFPPNDVEPDAGGSDAHFKKFVSAIVNHVGALDSSYAGISVWEMWNEFDRETFWQGTDQQLLRMSQDARSIIKARFPTAVVTTPNSTLPRVLKRYLQQPGAPEAADAVSLHAYVPDCAPEDSLQRRLMYFSRLRDSFMPGRPVYITEAGWGKPKNCPEYDDQAAFTARYLLLMYGGIAEKSGVDRLWWYAYDLPTGRLWDPDAGLLPPGKAYAETYKWITAATLVPNSCRADHGTRWACALKGPGGYEALAVWDASEPGKCSGAGCAGSSFTPPTKYKQYRDLSGKITPIAGPVAIGNKPILLETSPKTRR